MSAEEFIDAGDRVLVTAYHRGRGRGSGVEVDTRFYEPAATKIVKSIHGGKAMGRGKHLKGRIEGGGEILTHEQTLRLLSEMAENGSVTAAVALARELRLDPGEEEENELDAELDRLLRQQDD